MFNPNKSTVVVGPIPLKSRLNFPNMFFPKNRSACDFSCFLYYSLSEIWQYIELKQICSFLFTFPAIRTPKIVAWHYPMRMCLECYLVICSVPISDQNCGNPHSILAVCRIVWDGSHTHNFVKERVLFKFDICVL